MRGALLFWLAVILVAVNPPRVGGSTLAVGGILEVTFTTSSVPATCPGGPCDVLELFADEAGLFSVTDITADLFDGSTLLGTYFNAICCVPVFVSSSSLFQAGTPATVDFTAIDAGTIHGIIDMSIATGFVTWPAAPTPVFILGHATGRGNVEGQPNGIQIDSVSILPSPEPASTYAFLAGLISLGVLRLKGKRSARNGAG